VGLVPGAITASVAKAVFLADSYVTRKSIFKPLSLVYARKIRQETWDRCYDFKIFLPKNWPKNWRFRLKTKLNYEQICSSHWFLKKKENGKKSQKIMIITSRPSRPFFSYFGPALNILGLDDETARKTQPDWF
jgi:hypothetical protein